MHGERNVTRLIRTGNKVIAHTETGEDRLDSDDFAAFVADLPPSSSGPGADLDVMRLAMEEDVTARIIIGGRVTGYEGSRPGVLHEALLALQKNHALFPLGGFGGAARDAAVALGLLTATDALKHPETGPGYEKTIEEIGRFAGRYREAGKNAGMIWQRLPGRNARRRRRSVSCGR